MFWITSPAVAATLFTVSATVPKTRLKVLAEVPVPNTSEALPVTVNVSPTDAYVTKAVALNRPPAIVQFAAVAFAFRL